MAQAEGDKRKFARTRGGDASEERFRAAFKQITDVVAKLGLQQDVRDQAQVTPCPLACLITHRMHTPCRLWGGCAGAV